MTKKTKTATAQNSEETPLTDEIQSKFDQLNAELEESKDKYLRLYAEFENFKKRTIREKLDLMKNAAQDTMESILPVLDDFNRAKISADDENSPEQFSDGVLLVYNKLNSILEGNGLKQMESTGEVFDPELHEAITEIPAPDDSKVGTILDTVTDGYYLNDKIIRHAKVVVGK